MAVRKVRVAIVLAAGLAVWTMPQDAFAGRMDAPGAQTRTPEVSAQARRRARRPPRITVRPLERDLSRYKRACVPVFEERWIPQWGGRVLYASQSCRWVRVR
jgi:hypothetical protein